MIQLEPHEADSAKDAKPAPAHSVGTVYWFAIVAGFADLAVVLFKKIYITRFPFLLMNRHYAWRIPLATFLVLLAMGVLLVVVARFLPGLLSYRRIVWLIASLASLELLLRMPLYPWASVLFAMGVGSWIAWTVLWLESRIPRVVRWSAIAGGAAASIVLIGMIIFSLSRDSWIRQTRLARLPAPPARAKNVLFIVLDTVRAQNTSLHGYSRDTTPNLVRWANRGVGFDLAISPASWTLPSHMSMFTGYWPLQFDTKWDRPLLSGPPMLAEHLTSRGYLASGIVGNTGYCSYETGLDRGFVDYADYSPSFEHFLAESSIANQLLSAWYNQDAFVLSHLKTQSRDARRIRLDFLDWLDGRGSESGRPFFAFLNFMDAHEPFVTPRSWGIHFGQTPRTAADRRCLLDWRDLDKPHLSERQLALARDGYDDCIAYLDDELGKLLDELDHRGKIEDTVVVITSDHGESLGEHALFNHGSSVYMTEVHVPLLIISPGSVPAGKRVAREVSLRDAAATIVELADGPAGHRAPAGSRFPGRSLVGVWTGAADPSPGGNLTLSACQLSTNYLSNTGKRSFFEGTVLSLVANQKHYIRDRAGTEALFDLTIDPRENNNLSIASGSYPILEQFRGLLLRQLLSIKPIEGDEIEAVQPFIEQMQSLVPKADLRATKVDSQKPRR